MGVASLPPCTPPGSSRIIWIHTQVWMALANLPAQTLPGCCHFLSNRPWRKLTLSPCFCLDSYSLLYT